MAEGRDRSGTQRKMEAVANLAKCIDIGVMGDRR